jgi:hypothetical protein
MTLRWAGLLAALVLPAGCLAWSPHPVPTGPSTEPKPASGAELDRQLVDWCLKQPDTSDQRCRCWPIALRAEGLGDADLRDLLIRLGVVEGIPRTAPLGAAYETATVNCALMPPPVPTEEATL